MTGLNGDFQPLFFSYLSDGQKVFSHVGISICVIISIITPVNMHLLPVFRSDWSHTLWMLSQPRLHLLLHYLLWQMHFFPTLPFSHSWNMVLYCHQVAPGSPFDAIKEGDLASHLDLQMVIFSHQPQSLDFQTSNVLGWIREHAPSKMQCSFYVTVRLVCEMHPDTSWLSSLTSLIFNFHFKWAISAHYKLCVFTLGLHWSCYASMKY